MRSQFRGSSFCGAPPPIQSHPATPLSSLTARRCVASAHRRLYREGCQNLPSPCVTSKVKSCVRKEKFPKDLVLSNERLIGVHLTQRTTLPSHTGWLVCTLALLPIQLPASTHLARQQMKAQVAGSLPPTWALCSSQPLSSGIALASVGICGGHRGLEPCLLLALLIKRSET